MSLARTWLFSVTSLVTTVEQAVALQPSGFGRYLQFGPGEFVFEGPGDVDGDGFDDGLLLQVGGSTIPAVQALVRSGVNGSVLLQWSSAGPDPYLGSPGHAVLGGAGDIDSDGYPDITLTYASMGWGVELRSGFDGSLLGVLQASSGLPWFWRLGWPRAAPGDLNGDGSDDLIYGGGSTSSCYGVVVFDGATLSPLYTYAATPCSQVGQTLGGLDDVDGDGHPDFFIGDPLVPPEGWLGVYSGATGILIASMVGTAPAQQVGQYAIGMPDVDGDGTPEIAAWEFLGYVSPPVIRVFSAATFQTLYTIPFIPSGGWFKRINDTDGDGVDDLLLNRYTMEVRSGADGSLLDSASPKVGFSAYLEPLGDINGDGLGDFGRTDYPAFPTPFPGTLARSLPWGYSIPPFATESWAYVANNLGLAGAAAIGSSAQFDVLVPKHPGKAFQVVFSLEGRIPGIPLGPFLFPLVPDALFAASFGAGLGGVLDPAGAGSVSVVIPPDPSLQGWRVLASGWVIEPTATPLPIACVLTGLDFTIQ